MDISVLTKKLNEKINTIISAINEKYNVRLELNSLSTATCVEENTSCDFYYVVDAFGGMNGHGDWSEYLTAINEAFFTNFDAWLISIENDCLDDVFRIKIGLNGEK